MNAQSEKRYWHWLCEDKRLRYGSREVVEVGKTITYDGPLSLCNSGLHASEKAIDAVVYAPGPIICRVTLGDVVVEGGANTLHEFACRCAEAELKTAKVEDRRCWEAIETKRKWLKGEATDEQLAAARDAASAAARDAASAAARDAARAHQVRRLEHLLNTGVVVQDVPIQEAI
jgi:hypothetical protein